MTSFMLSRQPWVSIFIFPLMLTQEFYFSLFPAWYAYKLWLEDLCWRETHKATALARERLIWCQNALLWSVWVVVMQHLRDAEPLVWE